MAIAFVVATNGATNNGTTVSVSTSGHQVGDFAIIIVSTRSGSDGTIAYSSGGGGGWTQTGSQLNSTNVLGQATFYKFLDQADIDAPSSVVFSSGSAGNTKLAAVLMSFSGVDATPILDSQGQVNASSTNVAHPGLTVGAQAMMLLALSGWANNSTTTAVSGWTKDTNAVASSGGGPAGDRNTAEVQYRAFSSANPPGMTKVIGTAAVSTGRQVALKEAGVVDRNVNRSEAVTVTDTPTVARQAATPRDVTVSDTVAVADTPTVEVQEAEAATVTASESVTVTDYPNYYPDTIWVQEEVTVDVEDPTGARNLARTQPVAVSEDVVVEVSDPQVDVSDSVAVAEAIETALESFVDVSDALSVAEAIETALEAFLDVSEAVSLAEAIETALESFIAASEAVTVAEAVELDVSTDLAVSDSVAVAEAVDLALESNVDVSEAVTVDEAVDFEITREIAEAETVNVSENVNAFIVDPGLTNIITDDGVDVAEAIDLEVSDPEIAAADSVTVAEAVTVEITTEVDVSEAVAVAEAVTVTVTSVADLSIAVSDSVLLQLEPFPELDDIALAVSDSVGVAENVAVSIAVSEAVNISVSEAVSLTDTPDLRLVGFIRTSDAISVTEARTLATGDHVIAVSDAVAVTEATTVRPQIEVAVSESVSLVDTAEADIGVNLFITDTVGVVDVELVTETAPQVIVSDTVGVQDKRTILPPGGVIVVSGRTLFVGRKPGIVAGFLVDEAGQIITDEAGEPLLTEAGPRSGSAIIKTGQKPVLVLGKVR